MATNRESRENLTVASAFRVSRTRALTAGAVIAFAAASGAMAQDNQQPEPATPNTSQSLKLPQNPEVFGTAMPSVVKATAIVNGDVITQTDIEQRVQLLAIANGGQIPPEERQRVGEQVLRNLIDETLEIQAAKVEKIEIKQSDIDKTVQRVAQNAKRNPEQLAAFLETQGSNIKSLRRQIEGELAWQRLQRAKIESSVSVGD